MELEDRSLIELPFSVSEAHMEADVSRTVRTSRHLALCHSPMLVVSRGAEQLRPLGLRAYVFAWRQVDEKWREPEPGLEWGQNPRDKMAVAAIKGRGKQVETPGLLRGGSKNKEPDALGREVGRGGWF